MCDTSVSSTLTLVSSTLMSQIVSSVAASLFSVPWIAVSPFSTIEARDLARSSARGSSSCRARSRRRAASPCAWSTWYCAASSVALVTSSAVRSCSSCSSDTSCGLALLDLRRPLVVVAAPAPRWPRACRSWRPGAPPALPASARPRPGTSRDRSAEQLALGHHLSLLDGELDDAPGDVGAHVDLGVRLDLPAGGDRRDEVASLHGLDAHLDTLGAAGRGDGPRGQQHDGE